MAITRTIVSKRNNFALAIAEEEDSPGLSRAVYGTNALGDYTGIIKSASFKDLGSKAVLTNNTVPDTIVYTGLGIEATLEIAFKLGASKPMKGDIWNLLVPSPTSSEPTIFVVDEVEIKYEEEGFRMISITATSNAGLMTVTATGGEKLVSAHYTPAGDLVDFSTQPPTAAAITGN